MFKEAASLHELYRELCRNHCRSEVHGPNSRGLCRLGAAHGPGWAGNLNPLCNVFLIGLGHQILLNVNGTHNP